MRLVSFVLAILLAACKQDDPATSPDAPPRDADVTDAPVDGPPADANPACTALAGDYQPRVNQSADDTWPACISDQDQYVTINASVSTIARVGAFEQIATMLFTAAAPDRQAFTDALASYLTSEGLESRVGRREDEHYPRATTDGGAPADCNTLPTERRDLFPERCVGPVRLAPFIRGTLASGPTGFALGAGSDDPLQRRLAAAQIEAGLLHFLYLSVYKEAVTCANPAATRDCDSSWAYYGGGEQRAGGQGFARYVRGLETLTHERAFDGVLAVRCWRDLDDPLETADDATYAPLRTAALAQLDRAILRGVASILRARVVALQGATGDDARVHWEMIRHLGPALAREAAVRDATRAQTLATELARPVDQVDEAAIVTALDALFPCP